MVNAVNPAGIARRNAAATTDPVEARRNLQVAAAIEQPTFGFKIDVRDGRHFAVAFRGVTMAEALVRAIETYLPADAVDLILTIEGLRVEALPDEAYLA
jgi:hypothetical protein